MAVDNKCCLGEPFITVPHWPTDDADGLWGHRRQLIDAVTARAVGYDFQAFINASQQYNPSPQVWKNQKSTAPGIPRRSPIQVLTGPDVA